MYVFVCIYCKVDEPSVYCDSFFIYFWSIHRVHFNCAYISVYIYKIYCIQAQIILKARLWLANHEKLAQARVFPRSFYTLCTLWYNYEHVNVDTRLAHIQIDVPPQDNRKRVLLETTLISHINGVT